MKRLFSIVAVIAVVLLAVAIFYQSDKPDNAVLPGTQYPHGIAEGQSDSLQAQYGETQTKTNSNYSSTYSNGDADFLFLSPMYVTADPENPLAVAIGQALTAKLQMSNPAAEISWQDSGQWPQKERLAGAYITVSVAENNVVSKLGSRQQTIVANLTCGSEPYASNSTLSDNQTPPLITWHKDGEVKTLSEFEGVSLGVDHNQSAVEAIAKNMAENLNGTFDHLEKKAVPQSPDALPDYYFPTYQAYTLPPALAAHEPELIITGNRLLLHNESFWRFAVPASVELPLLQLRDALEADGWKVGRYEEDPNNIPMLRLKRDDSTLMLEIWPEKQARDLEDPTLPRAYIVRLQHRLSTAQIRALVDRAMDEHQPLPVIFALSRSWSRQQQQAFAERLKDDNYGANDEYLVKAIEWLVGKEPADEVLPLIERAYLFSLLNQSSIRSKLEKLGREASDDKKWKLKFPTREALAKFDIPVLKAGEVTDFEIGLGDYALFATAEPEEYQVHFIQITHSTRDQDQLAIRNGNVTPNRGSGWIESAFEAAAFTTPEGKEFNDGNNGVSSRFVVHSLDGNPNRFTVQASYQAPPKPEGDS